eukprot:4587819-Pyramimonas_sp.AAC.1
MLVSSSKPPPLALIAIGVLSCSLTLAGTVCIRIRRGGRRCAARPRSSRPRWSRVVWAIGLRSPL